MAQVIVVTSTSTSVRPLYAGSSVGDGFTEADAENGSDNTKAVEFLHTSFHLTMLIITRPLD